MKRIRTSARLSIQIALGLVLIAVAVGGSPIGTAADPERPQEIAELTSHPLVIGRLKGEAQAKRVLEFIEAEKALYIRGKTLYDLYQEFLEDIGVARIAAHLETRDPLCHGAAHDLGVVIAKRAGSLRLGMAVCGDTCTYGCVHGVFKSFFVKEWKSEAGRHDHAGHRQAPAPLPIEKIRREVNEVCREEITLVPEFFRGNCAHSIGHAFGGLGDRNVRAATAYCTAFDEIEMQYYCETGVFMELDKEIRTDLYDPGMSVDEKLTTGMRYCLENAGQLGACLRWVLKGQRTMKDVERLAQACLGLEGRNRRGCFNALGFLSRTYAVGNPPEIARICRFGDLVDKQLCVSGLVFMKKDARRKESLSGICRHLDASDLKAVCTDQEARFYYQVDNPVFDLMFVEASPTSTPPP